jgi:hypothetical protein
LDHTTWVQLAGWRGVCNRQTKTVMRGQGREGRSRPNSRAQSRAMS